MSLKGKHVFHGTSKNIRSKSLKPKKACWRSRNTGRMICEKDKLVFATGDKEIAICFAASLVDFAMFLKPPILVGHYSDLKKLDREGYLLTLDKKFFTNYDKLTNEYTSKKKVKIMKRRKIIPRKELHRMNVKILEIPDGARLPRNSNELQRLMKNEKK